LEFDELRNAIIEGKTKQIDGLVRTALEEGVTAVELSSQLIPAMEIVGQKMKSGEYFIPEVLMSVKTMKTAQEILKPLLAESGGGKPMGKVIIGTVQGDMHDIGKNLVSMMLEGGGFDVIDLGIDVPKEKFVQAVKETGAPVLGMSALLTTTMVHMRDVIEALEEAGERQKVAVIIGGAPVSQRFCDEIGADGMTDDAGSAVQLAKQLVSSRK